MTVKELIKSLSMRDPEDVILLEVNKGIDSAYLVAYDNETDEDAIIEVFDKIKSNTFEELYK